MLVPDKRPGAKPPVYGNVPKNDASMWMQQPVSADDFVSAPRKKPVAPGGGGRAVLVAIMVAMFVAVCGAGVWYAFLRESDVKPAALTTAPAPGSAAPAPAPAATTTVVTDAAVATLAADAAAPDAGTAAVVAGMAADAISGADPAIKKSKKRPAVKKAVTKKKTATAPKKRK